MSAAESAAESAAASAAKQNLKAKKNDFHHYIRHINVYGTYVRVKFIFSTPPKKEDFKEFHSFSVHYFLIRYLWFYFA